MSPPAVAAERPDILGKCGERRALRYLYAQGYDILDRNFRCRLGEIDLIAYDGCCLVFIEVKTRSYTEIAPAAEALEEEQKNRIRRAAAYYCKARKLEFSGYRFDLVAIDIRPNGQPDIRLFKNAF